jgi:cob(I)alamin adenosyltransferase
MVRLTRIYTKTGDKGTTALGTGKRVAKHDQRVEAFGTVDEANAAIGLVRLHTADQPDADAMLARIQNDLFDLGADLCAPQDDTRGDGAKERLRIADTQVERLEQEIDRMNAELAPLNSFVLPGGSLASAHLHLARTIARRAERHMTRLAESSSVGETAIRYINRLSDHLFVMARWLNDKGKADVLWKPGANR